MMPHPEQHFHLLDSLPMLIWSSGRDARCNYFNRGWLAFTGRTLEEELGDGWTDGIHRGDLNDCLKSYLTAFRAREPFEMEYRLRRHDGSYRWVSLEGRPIFDEHESFAGFIAYGFDTTEGKLADEALKGDQRCLQMLANLSPVAIFRMDLAGQCQFVNERWVGITGLSEEESLGQGWFEAIHPADQARFERELEQSFRDQGEVNIECRIVSRLGEESWVLFQGNPEFDGEGALRGYVGTVTDLTKRKQLADKERKLSKIESLGTLAGQIAHEFNNLLTPIILNLSIAQNQLHQPGLLHELRGRLEEAEEAAGRAKSLTQRLISLGKSGNPMKRTVDLRALVQRTVESCLAKARAIPYFHFPEGLWQADLDPNHFAQAIHNLAVNAAEAMSDRGVIRVSAENVEEIDEPDLPETTGPHVCIRIADDGVGISPANLDRIFDLYFSTKSGHSGLGLATTQSVVHNHGGHLLVDSKPNQGTTVKIYIPANTAAATAAPPTKPKRPAQGESRVLIMDDDDLVRSSVRAILQTFGYEVETARDGSEALEIYVAAQEEGKPISITLMDLTIQGGMGGREAIAELKALDPSAKAVVCSGHSNDPIMANFAEYGFHGAIRKPFHPDELGTLLGELLCA